MLISVWDKLTGEEIAKYGVAEENIFDLDKTGFQMGVISTSEVVTTSERKGQPRIRQPSNWYALRGRPLPFCADRKHCQNTCVSLGLIGLE